MAVTRGDALLLLLVLAAMGTVDAAYLTYEWYAAPSSSFCDLSDYFSCTVVRNSPFSSLGGLIPTAAIGLAGFVILLGLGVLELRGVGRIGPWTVERWLVVFAALGVLIGYWLTLIEVFVIQAICPLCLFGFLLSIGILGIMVLVYSGEEE